MRQWIYVTQNTFTQLINTYFLIKFVSSNQFWTTFSTNADPSFTRLYVRAFTIWGSVSCLTVTAIDFVHDFEENLMRNTARRLLNVCLDQIV